MNTDLSDSNNSKAPKKQSTPLSVCFLSHTSNSKGGAEVALLEIITYLVKTGSIAANVILPEEGSMADELKKIGVPYVTIPFRPWCNSQIRNKKERQFNNELDMDAYEELIKKLKKDKPDLAFTNTIVSPWLATAAERIGIPHVWMLHEFGDLDHGFVFDYGYRNSLSAIDMLSDTVIVNSKALKEHISGPVRDTKITQIYYAMSDNVKPTTSILKPFKKRDSFKCLIVGRILPAKGQLEAVKAIIEANKQGCDAELLMMGVVQDKAYASIITRLVQHEKAEEYITIIGHQENAQDYIAAADTLLMCSNNECFGRVTAEAMLKGRPVIGSASGATKEIIEDGTTGLLYSPNNITELVDKIKQLASNTQLREKMGKAAKSTATKRFNHESSEKRILNTLRKANSTARLPVADVFLDAKERLEQTLSDKNTIIAAQEASITSKDKIIANNVINVINLNEELQASKSTIKDITNSRAWKVARFLQRAKALIKN